MELVVAAEYNDEVAASIAKGMLEANGIAAIVEGSHMARMYMGGATWAAVRLLVRSDDLKAATDLLRQHGDI